MVTKCNHCDGTGTVLTTDLDLTIYEDDCTECDGTGKCEADDDTENYREQHDQIN